MLIFKFLTIIFTSFYGFGNQIGTYFPLSGYRDSAEVRAKMAELVNQKKFDPNIWPEVKIIQKSQSLGILGKKKPYFEIELPVFDKNEDKFLPFKFKYFQPSNINPSISRLVVIYPTIEGETIIERNLAKISLESGHQVLIAPVFDFPYKTGAEGLPDLAQKTVFGIKAVKTFFDLLEYAYRNDEMESQELVKILKFARPKDILQIGVSNGTMAAFSVSQTDSRVSQQILIIPIGNVPGVMATTTNDKLTAFRKEQMEHYGLKSIKDYADLVRRKLVLDSMDLVDSFHSVETLAFTQKNDDTVPYQFQKEFLDRMRAIVVSKAMSRVEEDKVYFKTLYESVKKLHNESPTEATLASLEKFQIIDSKAEEHFKNRSMEHVLQSIQHQQDRDLLFFELGFGHVKKILAIAFLYTKIMKEFMNKKFDLTSELPFEKSYTLSRSEPLLGSKSISRVSFSWQNCRNSVSK